MSHLKNLYMPYSKNEMRRAIFRVLAGRDRPIGQGAITLELRGEGFDISTPTIGRKLQELEFEGIVRKVGVDGRVLTSKGQAKLEAIERESQLRDSGNALLAALQRGDRRHILDLLEARRVIEGETAAMAATRASAEALREMRVIIRAQHQSVERGDLGIQEDISLHNLIARAAGNDVLASLVALLRNHARYNLVVASTRAASGSRLVVDHEAIVAAIERRDPGGARRAMERHLRGVVTDLNRHWRRNPLKSSTRGQA